MCNKQKKNITLTIIYYIQNYLYVVQLMFVGLFYHLITTKVYRN